MSLYLWVSYELATKIYIYNMQKKPFRLIYNKPYSSQKERQNGFEETFISCVPPDRLTHAQWMEILGRWQFTWTGVHMDFPTHSWCVLLGPALNVWGARTQSSGKVSVTYDEGF